MTPQQHGEAIRAAAASLNNALRLAARAGIGAIVTVQPVASATPVVEQEVTVIPFARV